MKLIKNNILILKSEQLKLLDKLVRFLDQNKILYFIAYGTLLGAVRHSDYIPWDDDIDIWLKREDYNKLIKLTNVNEFSIFHYSLIKNFSLPFIKIVDNSKYLIKENSSYRIKNLGINIDIFPLDYINENKFISKFMFFNYRILRTIMNIKLVNYSSNRNIFLSIIIFFLKFALLPIPIRLVIKLIDFNAQLSKQKTNSYTSLIWGYGSREIFPTSSFNSFKLFKFNTRLLKGPLNEYFILSKIYGNFLKLPSINKRKTRHKFSLYKK